MSYNKVGEQLHFILCENIYLTKRSLLIEINAYSVY